jgi:hypothetical protein
MLIEYDCIIESRYTSSTLIDNNGNFEDTGVLVLNIVPLWIYTSYLLLEEFSYKSSNVTLRTKTSNFIPNRKQLWNLIL